MHSGDEWVASAFVLSAELNFRNILYLMFIKNKKLLKLSETFFDQRQTNINFQVPENIIFFANSQLTSKKVIKYKGHHR